MSLLERLPPVRGRLTADQPLAPFTWLRVGGPAEALFQPADADDLSAFLAATPADIPVTVVGVGSNLIVRDGGVAGVVIRLGRGFAALERVGDSGIRAGAAVPDAKLATQAAQWGIDGLTFLRGIPGAVGGALRMNAGCYGSYIADIFRRAVGYDRSGGRHEFTPADMQFGYRSCGLPDEIMFTEAEFEGFAGDPADIAARMQALLEKRAATQPVKERTAGSTFRNPAGYSSTGAAGEDHSLKAWKLIEDAGCKGLRLGGAQMSEMHANFLVNTGEATAADLENLGEEVRRRVLLNANVQLEWEVKRIGTNPTD